MLKAWSPRPAGTGSASSAMPPTEITFLPTFLLLRKEEWASSEDKLCFNSSGRQRYVLPLSRWRRRGAWGQTNLPVTTVQKKS